MLAKFEKYLQPAARSGNIKLPVNIKGDILLCNQNRLTPGMIQRLNVQPNDLFPSQNKQRIGIHTKAGREYDFNGDWSYLTTSSVHNRKVRVYQAEINHMQSTPYNRRGNYVMQFENTGWTRSNAMLWGRCSNDPYHRYSDKNEIMFYNLEAAYHYARSLGCEVDVIYPHERYHEQKSYADNFLFPKESANDFEDIGEISIENLEKKLL